MKVGVTGATGFIGRRLCAVLAARGVVITAFTRGVERARSALPPGVHLVAWDPMVRPAPIEALEGLDAVVHLAGEPVKARRWTPEERRRIHDSRALGTRHLVEGLAGVTSRPRALVSASAVGYYGDRGDERLDESSPPGHDFMAQVCVAWEAEAQRAEALGLRVVRLRSGLVLGSKGGLLQTMALPFRFGLGGTLGGGRQWVSWIHLEDEIGLILHCLEREDVRGPLNATSPQPATNRELTRELGSALGKPALLNVPKLALRLALGEVASMILASQRAYPTKAIETGYRFVFPELRPALAAALR